MATRKPWERRADEGEAPYEYFLHYRDSAKSRSVVATAGHFGKSPNTIHKYSSRFDWKERSLAWDDRVQEVEDKVILSAQQKLAKEHLKTLGAARALANMTLARTIQKFKDGKASPTTIREATALMREAVTLERLVTDQATSRNEDSKLDPSKLEAGKAEELLELLKEAGWEG